MSIKIFVHTLSKRAETSALLDTGAMENFINEAYARRSRLLFKRLVKPRKIINVDGTPNILGTIHFYTDLEVQTGATKRKMRFFLTGLGDRDVILGYPWFAAVQPKIHWAKGWIDFSQLPVVLRTEAAARTKFLPRTINVPRKLQRPPMHIAFVTFPSRRQTYLSQLAEKATSNLPPTLPNQYKRHTKVFSEEESQRLPGPRLWDHAIELKPGAPATLPGKVYALTQAEQQALEEFIKEHQRKGYIRPSKSPYAAPFFFIKKKDGKLRPVQDYRKINEWTIRNRYPLLLIPELIARVKDSTCFTKFDVRWGYNNVCIKEGDEWKAAFITNKGLRTASYVLQPDKLPSHVPNNDERVVRRRTEKRLAHHLYGRYPHSHIGHARRP
jgi:hypothetical protein